MHRTKLQAAVLAVILAFATLTAPIARAFVVACDRCPSDCPMHDKGRLPCHHGHDSHNAHSSAASPCGHSSPAIGAPGCGHGHEIPGVVLPPALISGPVELVHSMPALAPGHLLALDDDRPGDSPETPPPITRS
jgi:hypothetical protein